MKRRRTISFLTVLAAFMVLAAVLLAEGALHIVNRPQPDAAAAEACAAPLHAIWKPVSIAAADGVRLNAWYFEPDAPNGGGVLLLHGVADSRIGMLGHAQYLLRGGYAVLTPDSRGHGSSGGNLISYGVREAEDTARWLRWLGQQPGVTRVYGMGESMGAANLIEALALHSPIRAAVAECPFASFAEVADYRLSHLSGIHATLLRPIRELGFVYARARYGVNLWKASPAEAMAHSRAPVLLIHGADDVNIPPAQSRELHAMNRATTELWEVPHAVHVSAIVAAPVEMPRRVLAWFASR